jgi:hypothetical protein
MTATNWGAAAPVAGDDLVFPAGAANPSNTNNFAAGTTFNSITFSGGTYTLNGNGITLGAGGIQSTGGTTHSVLLPITLGASQTWHLGTGGTSTQLSATNLNGSALIIADSNNPVWSGPISGFGNITVNNSAIDLGGANTTLAPFIINDSLLDIGLGATYPGPITGNDSDVGLEVGTTVGPVAVNGPFSTFFAGFGMPNGTANTRGITLKDFVVYGEQIAGISDFNQANVTGTVTLSGVLLLLSQSIVPPGTTFTIINNDGTDAVAGRFVSAPEGGNITSGGLQSQNFTITYRGGTGNDVVLTAQSAATIVTSTLLTASPDPVEFGQSVTLTATVTGPPAPYGTVTFIELVGPPARVTELAIVPLNSSGVAAFTTNTLTLGPHTIVALYNGSGSFAASSDLIDLLVTVPVPALNTLGLALLAFALAAWGAIAMRPR